MSNFVYFQKCACVSVSMADMMADKAGRNVLCLYVCVSARVGDGLSSPSSTSFSRGRLRRQRQRQRSLTKFRVRRLLRPRKVARQAGCQAGSGTPWQEITYLHGAREQQRQWGECRAEQGKAGWCDWLTDWRPHHIAAKVTQSNGAARNQREKVASLGPWAISHSNPGGCDAGWAGAEWGLSRVSLVVLKLRVAESLASICGRGRRKAARLCRFVACWSDYVFPELGNQPFFARGAGRCRITFLAPVPNEIVFHFAFGIGMQ